MNNALQVFNFEDNHTRIALVDGEPWVVAKDVCEALGYSEQSNPARLMQAVPKEWKGMKRIHTPGGEQEMLCLSEQGLYFFLGRSDKPKALPYQVWIAGKVLPTIRKHGVYMTPQKIEEALTNPDFIIRLAQELKTEREKRTALEAQTEADRPKVLFADSVTASQTSILIGDLAKLIRQNGYNIGQNRLFQWLRDNGYLVRRRGDSYNMPTQRSMELGLFEVLERTHNNPDGSIRVTKTPKATGKGQVYFVNRFLAA